MSGVSNVIQLDDGSYIGTLLPFREMRARPLDRARIMKARSQINRAIEQSGWHFQTDPDRLDLGEPYLKLGPKLFVLRDDWSVQETFDHWEQHPIQIECLMILNLLLLFYLRDELVERGLDLEQMRSAMKIDLTTGLMDTGIHDLVGSVATQLVPLGDLNHQREVVQQIGAGYYCYCRGPIGWYDYIYARGDKMPLETVYQGENALSLGNSEFLTFSRDYYGHKMKCPQLVIKPLEYILEELAQNGRDQLGRIYPEHSTSLVTTRCGDRTYYQNKFDVAGIESLQLLGTML